MDEIGSFYRDAALGLDKHVDRACQPVARAELEREKRLWVCGDALPLRLVRSFGGERCRRRGPRYRLERLEEWRDVVRVGRRPVRVVEEGDGQQSALARVRETDERREERAPDLGVHQRLAPEHVQ